MVPNPLTARHHTPFHVEKSKCLLEKTSKATTSLRVDRVNRSHGEDEWRNPQTGTASAKLPLQPSNTYVTSPSPAEAMPLLLPVSHPYLTFISNCRQKIDMPVKEESNPSVKGPWRIRSPKFRDPGDHRHASTCSQLSNMPAVNENPAKGSVHE
ncbi:hypothetical protein M440DRAFT_1089597 [Trichoderma longibrachiatum ATCC 18648]|uniref:Uncharacterized protein n=1 Tax=Trichoderma longibrachiatum ATCC 18648 TaxID=983965 RepID=A0A2T4BT17_TRILO|nr:hypothetical protein M440DRAFT_1089597 [Trichoderma longibrachiatum ATCC 18648]